MRALQLPADAGPRDDGTGAERGSVAAGREPCRPSGNAASAAAPSLGPEHRGNGWRASMRSCSREGRGRRSSPSARAWFCLSSRAWCVGAEVGAERALRRPFVLRRSASGSARTVPRAPRPPAPRGQQRSSALYPWLSGAAGGERRARASPAAFGSVCGAGWAAPRRWGAAGGRPWAAVSLRRPCSVPRSEPDLGRDANAEERGDGAAPDCWLCVGSTAVSVRPGGN